ncbi:MAG TPA: hypothetical protein VF980_04760 [Thermoanaerobaculia bacterium]
MRRTFAIALLALIACSRGPQVPVNTLLWRLGAWFPAPNGTRAAAAEIISFRKSGEYVEHYCNVIERADSTVYIMSNGVHFLVIGKWKQKDEQVVATRELTTNPNLCGDVAYRISGNSVMFRNVQFSPVTRLVSPDFEIYVNDGRKVARPCTSD